MPERIRKTKRYSKQGVASTEEWQEETVREEVTEDKTSHRVWDGIAGVYL